jgi:hypothetical protein
LPPPHPLDSGTHKKPNQKPIPDVWDNKKEHWIMRALLDAVVIVVAFTAFAVFLICAFA